MRAPSNAALPSHGAGSRSAAAPMEGPIERRLGPPTSFSCHCVCAPAFSDVVRDTDIF